MISLLLIFAGFGVFGFTVMGLHDRDQRKMYWKITKWLVSGKLPLQFQPMLTIDRCRICQLEISRRAYRPLGNGARICMECWDEYKSELAEFADPDLDRFDSFTRLKGSEPTKPSAVEVARTEALPAAAPVEQDPMRFHCKHCGKAFGSRDTHVDLCMKCWDECQPLFPASAFRGCEGPGCFNLTKHSGVKPLCYVCRASDIPRPTRIIMDCPSCGRRLEEGDTGRCQGCKPNGAWEKQLNGCSETCRVLNHPDYWSCGGRLSGYVYPDR